MLEMSLQVGFTEQKETADLIIYVTDMKARSFNNRLSARWRL